jgi:hypothetical protein
MRRRLRLAIARPGAFRTPLTITQKLRLLPDQKIIESFCTDNEKDREHYVVTK